MKRLIYIVAFLLISIFYNDSIAQDCDKCNIDKLLTLYENMNNLGYDVVLDFVCTFDTICKTNVEFSQWSNELLFDLIEQDVNLLNDALYELGYNYVKLVAAELENPVVEEDIRNIYDIVKNANGRKDMIEEQKRALRKVAESEGLKLEK